MVVLNTNVLNQEIKITEPKARRYSANAVKISVVITKKVYKMW